MHQINFAVYKPHRYQLIDSCNRIQQLAVRNLEDAVQPDEDIQAAQPDEDIQAAQPDEDIQAAQL